MRWISRATSVGAGEQHAADARVGDQRGADLAVARQQLQRVGGTPASCSRRPAWAAISGVSSAGLASTALPAASAAATWPVKIASGKFHGLMHTTGPSGPHAGRVEAGAQPAA